jgi:hypothetical protein
MELSYSNCKQEVQKNICSGIAIVVDLGKLASTDGKTDFWYSCQLGTGANLAGSYIFILQTSRTCENMYKNVNAEKKSTGSLDGRLVLAGVHSSNILTCNYL